MNDLEEIVSALLNEILSKLASETTRNITYAFFDVSKQGNCLRGTVSLDNTLEDAHMEMRLWKRHTERPTRFRLQAISRDLSPETGYSGFEVYGRLTLPQGAELLGRVNRYNQLNWDTEFQLAKD